MSGLGPLQYRISRALGRFAARTAAILTFGRMPPFASTSVLVVDGENVLVVIDSIRDEPILPGGHLAWREAPEHAAIREVREETGIEVRIRELLSVLAGIEWAGEPGVVRVVYHGDMIGGRLTSSAEGRALWMPITELASSSTRDAAIVREWLAGRSARPAVHEGA